MNDNRKAMALITVVAWGLWIVVIVPTSIYRQDGGMVPLALLFLLLVLTWDVFKGGDAGAR